MQQHGWTQRLLYWAFLVAQVVRNLPANAGDVRDLGLIPGSERYPGEGNGNPLWYFCLGNRTDRVTWWATVHGVAKESDTAKWLKNNI